MSQKILQINFQLSVSAKDYEQACLPAAQPIADTPGLRLSPPDVETRMGPGRPSMGGEV